MTGGTPPGDGAGYVTITAPYTDESVTLLLDKPPTPSGGVGGWESIAVPRRPAVRSLDAPPDDGLTLEVIIEKRPEATVSQQIRTLRSIATATEKSRPRQVEVTGQLPPLPLDRWLIDDIAWGESTYTAKLHLIEQWATITLGPPPTTKALEVGRGGRAKYRSAAGKKGPRYEPILPGESLQEFASRTLGNPSRWRDIAKIQKPPIKDPRKVKDNRKLRLP